MEILNNAIAESVDIGAQSARIDALKALGDIYLEDGEREAAVDKWSQALLIAQEHGVQREEVALAAKIKGVQ